MLENMKKQKLLYMYMQFNQKYKEHLFIYLLCVIYEVRKKYIFMYLYVCLQCNL